MVTTLREALRETTQRLRLGGIEAASFEAAQLVGWACGVSAERARTGDDPVSRDRAEQLGRAVKRRTEGEPLQYIIGRWSFMGLEFIVTPDVLIPRPDTETVVESLLPAARGIKSPRVLDLCCGSGCIGISMCALVPRCTAVMCDISPAALEIARRNAELNCVNRRVETVIVDVRAPVWESEPGKFDIIVSNPPYIPTEEIDTLQRELAFEPRIALDGGEDGLDFFRAIIKNFPTLLKKGGLLAFECGAGQDGTVAAMMEGAGFSDVHISPDLNGIGRLIYGKSL